MAAETGVAPEWRVIGETVPGASHLRAGLPNQDAILQVRESGRGLPVIVSVSDGHGSDKCFRSHRGSRFAVRIAARLLVEFLDERRAAPDPAEVEGELRGRVPREFVRQWRAAVEADLKARPFTAEELRTLEEKDGARARKLVEQNPPLAYGATSLSVAVGETFVVYLQLGDGDILTVSDAGEVAKALPDDERLFANETTSLCTPDAESNFRARVQGLTSTPPALILISTDGYVNSFSDEEGFLRVGSDLLEMMRAEGFDSINSSLRGWLEEATRAGSGDDTTLGVICRMDALTEPATANKAEGADETAASNAPALAPIAPAVAEAEATAPELTPAGKSDADQQSSAPRPSATQTAATQTAAQNPTSAADAPGGPAGEHLPPRGQGA
jgi:serine/threonine protein phosphatase PrpC